MDDHFWFDVNEWLLGKISIATMDTKGVFIAICARYWQNGRQMHTDDLQQEFGKHEEELCYLNGKYLHIEGESVTIPMLDKQAETVFLTTINTEDE